MSENEYYKFECAFEHLYVVADEEGWTQRHGVEVLDDILDTIKIDLNKAYKKLAKYLIEYAERHPDDERFSAYKKNNIIKRAFT